jgi:3',5'-cyclic-nucleotide phosphodiesterase
MRLRVLGNAGGSAPGRQLSSYLVDDVLAVDAGALTTALELPEQLGLRVVALTHGHLDHVWSLPLFLVHRLGRQAPACQVVASAYTLETVHTHLFNERIWVTLHTVEADDPAKVAWEALEPGSSMRVLDRYELTAIPLDHTVPSQAYLVRKGERAVIVCGDTTTTGALWETANETEGLAGVLVECAWPDALEELAVASQHMAPRLLLADLRKLVADVPVHVIHRKPGFEDAIEEELRAGGDDRLRFVRDGDVLDL